MSDTEKYARGGYIATPGNPTPPPGIAVRQADEQVFTAAQVREAGARLLEKLREGEWPG